MPEKKQTLFKRTLFKSRYILFLGLGIGIFWYIYRDIDTETLSHEAREIKYGWLGLSVLIGMLSHISRAYRWNMLIFPMGYKPKTINTFLSVMVMYLTNMIVPRGGEFARCGVLSRYEHIPFSKLVGTMVVERITDVIALIFFTILIIMAQINVFENFLEDHPAVQTNLEQLFSTRNIFIASCIFISMAVFSIIFRYQLKRTLVYRKFQKIIDDFIHGIKTIRQLKNRWLYIGHSVFIYFMWLFMLYVVFFSFEPTAHLSLIAGATAFVMSGLAMIAPIQAGFGPWHFMVIETLVIYGVEKTDGKIFAFIAHTTTNLSLAIAGTIALILLPVINRNNNSRVSRWHSGRTNV